MYQIEPKKHEWQQSNGNSILDWARLKTERNILSEKIPQAPMDILSPHLHRTSIPGSSGPLQRTALVRTSSFTVITDLLLYDFYFICILEIQVRLWHFHNFVCAWSLMDFGVELVHGWNINRRTRNVFLFSQNTPFLIMKMRDPPILGM